MSVLGLDTSNYTTSIAWFNGTEGENQSQLLPVKPGELGLRQSDALFAHVKCLPDLADRLFSHVKTEDIKVIGVSTRPRAVEGSYMPCFLAGVSQAETMASLLHVPVVQVSHQQGHLAAALWSADRMDIMNAPFLAWHLSGGTTELLYVKPDGWNMRCTRIGGTTDISAGQLIDRTGQMLQLQFPAGKELDRLSKEARDDSFFKVKCKGFQFSLSGVQNKVQEYYANTGSSVETAGYALRCVCRAVREATDQAKAAYPDLPVVFSGGVASNSMLREILNEAVFCPPQFATDNAMGVAVLTHRALGGV